MKSEVATKYICFLNIAHNDRNELFSISKTELDYDEFFKVRLFILSSYNEMRIIYNKFKKRRAYIFKQFKIKQNIIHKKHCECVLKYIFCYYIKILILEFI